MPAKREKREKRERRSARKPAPKAAEPKQVEEVGGGMGFEDTAVLATTVMLAVAVVLVMLANGAY